MIENTILKANRQGRKALVFAMTYKDLWAVEAAAQAGFDAISLDGEHGAFSSSDVDDIVRVANGYGMSVIARIPNIQPNTINLWLDRGIQGVTGPHIETKEEARCGARSARPPGVTSFVRRRHPCLVAGERAGPRTRGRRQGVSRAELDLRKVGSLARAVHAPRLERVRGHQERPSSLR